MITPFFFFTRRENFEVNKCVIDIYTIFCLFSSGSIEVTSLLSVDAHVVESGVKVAATLHSSTGLDLTVKVLDGYGVDVKIGLPVKKQEILNFNSDVVSIIREKKGPEVESPIKFDVQRYSHDILFNL